MTDWTVEYKRKMRDFMQRRGTKVEFEPDGYVSIYGWSDWQAHSHIRKGCSWIVPEGAVMTEESYSQFVDTFSDNEYQVGINVSGCRCKCGEYKNVTLRFDGTIADVMLEITGAPARAAVIL